MRKFSILPCILTSFFCLCIMASSAWSQCGNILYAPSRVFHSTASVYQYHYPSYGYQHVNTVVLPLYTLGYVQPTSVDSLSVLEEIRALRKDHNQLLQVLASQGSGNKAFGVNEPAHATIFRNNCSSCHTAGALKSNKFVMFTAGGGQLANLSQDQFEKCIDRIVAEEMPPGKKMSQKDSSMAIVSLVKHFQTAAPKSEPGK